MKERTKEWLALIMVVGIFIFVGIAINHWVKLSL